MPEDLPSATPALVTDRSAVGTTASGRAGGRGSDDPPTWLTLADGSSRLGVDPPVTARKVLLQLGIVALVVIALVGGIGVVVAREVAQREAINEAADTTSLLASAVVQPALEDALLSDTPDEARARLDEVVRSRVLSTATIRRVKIWSPEGVVLYSDEPALVGATFELGADELVLFDTGATLSEVADLEEPENAFERDLGPLLSVYRPVYTPGGQPLMFEAYYHYPTISARTGQLWRGLAGLMLASQLLLISLLVPLGWTLLDRLRRGQRQREELLERAVDASAQERQRIAGALHDGVVQELVATSYAVAAGAQQADAAGQSELGARLRSAAKTVRSSIGGLRSLLVDIYPPNLNRSGLSAVLSDLADTVRSRNVDVWLDLPEAGRPVHLDAAGEQLVFRVAQETLRNAARHAGARSVDLRLFEVDGTVILEISDDGAGFDVLAARRAAAEGHLGMQLLPDLANQAGAVLRVATAPGQGTRWRLEIAAADVGKGALR